MMDNMKLLRPSKKDPKSGKKKSSTKTDKDQLTFDPNLGPVAAPHGVSGTLDASTPTSSAIIPLLSPVYILVPPQFPETGDCKSPGLAGNKDRSPRMLGSDRSPRTNSGSNRSPRRATGSDRSPRSENDLADKRSLSGKRPASPSQLADPTQMLAMFHSRCVL